MNAQDLEAIVTALKGAKPLTPRQNPEVAICEHAAWNAAVFSVVDAISQANPYLSRQKLLDTIFGEKRGRPGGRKRPKG